MCLRSTIRSGSHLATRSAVGTVVLAVAVSAALPVTARSATVTVDPRVFEYRTMVTFVAVPGESNDVRVAWQSEGFTSKSVTISDAGAPLTAGSQCESLDMHTVRCTPALTMSNSLVHADLELGDRDDRVRVSDVGRGALAAAGVLFADGGSGDDVLDARSGFMAGFDGGGGTDHLYGAEFESFLADGDRDGAEGDAAPGPDVIEGGPGRDTVSYRQRTADVRVDLADGRPEGAHGEGDIVRAVESVDGGAGDDRLAGDQHGNWLNGGLGDDVLTGRGGDDALGGVTGAWAASPPSAGTAAEPLAASAAGDVVDCGAGTDWVNERRSRDFTPPRCEWLSVRRAGRMSPMRLPAYPAARPPGLTYRFGCRDPEYRFPKCSGRMVLRRPSGRVLAEGRIGRGKPVVNVRLQLTPLGRALAARRGRVLARVGFRGRNLPAAGWTIRLRLPGA
jgi:hypothetical protein